MTSGLSEKLIEKLIALAPQKAICRSDFLNFSLFEIGDICGQIPDITEIMGYQN